jgi:hypothetical protein
MALVHIFEGLLQVFDKGCGGRLAVKSRRAAKYSANPQIPSEKSTQKAKGTVRRKKATSY